MIESLPDVARRLPVRVNGAAKPAMVKTRIALVIESLGRGGAQRQLALLLAHLNRGEFEPVVVSLAGAGIWSPEIRGLDVPLVELPRRGGPAARLLALTRTLRALRPDLVHTFLLYDNIYGTPAALLARAPRLVASRRYDPDAAERSPKHWLNRRLIYLADAVVCNTARAVRTAPRWPAPRHVLIPNAFAPVAAMSREAARADIGLGRDDLVIGNVGRLVAVKNPGLFAAVAETVRRRYPAARFVWIGDGPLAGALANEPGVTVTGDRPNAAALLLAFDVFLVTSDREGMSNALMEAMGASLACVATNAGGNEELVIDGECGYVRGVRDVVALAQCVERFLADRDLGRSFGTNARRRMETEFTAPRMADRMQALYRQVVDAERSPERGRMAAEARR